MSTAQPLALKQSAQWRGTPPPLCPLAHGGASGAGGNLPRCARPWLTPTSRPADARHHGRCRRYSIRPSAAAPPISRARRHGGGGVAGRAPAARR